MTCTSPLRGFRAPGGQLTFSRGRGWVDRPVTVACGQCTSCRLARSEAWALRCVHEQAFHEKSCFVTLTYDDGHVPSDGSVDVRHWQLFAKRLRKRLGPFRFFHCGEYGELNFRPHYHACIFGHDFFSDRFLFSSSGDYEVFVSDVLSSVWGLGFATVGELNFRSAAYVARYVMKKATGPLAVEEYRRLDLETGEEFFVRPPYVTMSRRPGLGKQWISKFVDDVYPEDEVVHEGRRHWPPVFYDRHLESIDPSFLEGVKRARVKRAREDELSPDQLYAREFVANQRLGAAHRDV